MLRTFWQHRVKNSLFLRQIGVLSTGNAASYLLAFALLPLLTRLYPKEAFDWLTLYMSWVSVLGLVSTLQYDQALVVAKQKLEQSFLLGLGVLSATLLFCVGTLFYVFLGAEMDWMQGYDVRFIGLVLLGMWVAALYQLFLQWLNRQERYAAMSVNKVVVAVTTVGAQLLFWKWSVVGVLLGLVAGHVLGKAVSLVVAIPEFMASIGQVFRSAWTQTKGLIEAFSDFQRWSLPVVLVDRVAFELPVFLISFWFTDALADYGMAYRVLMLPMALIVSSYAQVFMRKAADYLAQNKEVVPLIYKTWLLVGGGMLIPFIVLFFYGELLFAWIFGEVWASAGAIAALLVPFQWISVMSSTTSVTFTVLRKQAYQFAFSVLSVVYRLASFWLGYQMGELKLALIYFSVSHIVALIGYNLLMIWQCKKAHQAQRGML